jgi:acyl-CoA thioesterase I
MTENITIAVISLVLLLFSVNGYDRKASAGEARSGRGPGGVILTIGNSLTAGFGVAESEAFPARLQEKLHAAGYPYQVINAGISGETSAGALYRLNRLLSLKPDIVIFETGANDGLQGISAEQVEQNITQAVRILKQQGIVVVLAGMRMFPSFDGHYNAAFVKIYPDVARKQEIILIPSFLQGVAGDSRLNQGDGIHPTAEGYRIVTENLYPYVVQAIEELQRRRAKQ